MATTPTRHWPNAVLVLDQRLRRCPNIKTTLGECAVFTDNAPPVNTCVGVSCFELPVAQTVFFQTQYPAESISGIIYL